MEITIKELYSINEALAYLSSCQSSSWYTVMKNKRILKSFLENAEEDRKTIIERFAIKDEKGFVTIIKDGKESFTFKAEDEEKECLVYLEKFYKEKVDVNFHQSSVSSLIQESHPEIIIETLLDKIFIE